jgi:hypothetical protein
MVTHKNRTVLADVQFLLRVGREGIDADVVHRFLKLAVAVLRAQNAPFLDRGGAEAYVRGATALFAVARETGARVTPHNLRQGSPPGILGRGCGGVHRHSCCGFGLAGQGELAIYLSNAELASHIGDFVWKRTQTGIGTKGWNVYAGLTRRIQNRHIALYLQCLPVYRDLRGPHNGIH